MAEGWFWGVLFSKLLLFETVLTGFLAIVPFEKERRKLCEG